MSAPSKTSAEAATVGCFQIVLLSLLAVNYVIVAMSHALPVFHNYTPKFYCESNAAGPNRTYGCINKESFQTLSLLSRIWSSEANFTSCANGYTWELEYSEKSVVMDWNLICEKGHLSYLGPTIYYVGVAIGAWVAGLVADRIGRLPVLAICLYTQGTMTVATYIVQNYPVFLVLRGLQGFFAQGLQNSTYILVLELFPKKFRTLVATTMEIGWALGLVLLATLSYFIRDWRILQLAVSVPTALTVLYIWIIPESPRWLLAKGKSTEADIALEKIVKYNACCSGRSRRALVAEADNSANSTPAKPERKSRLLRAVDEARDLSKEEPGESTNLLTPPNPVQRKSRRSSIKAITENLEKRLSISNTETAISEVPSHENNSETEQTDLFVEASISSKINRDSKISLTVSQNGGIEESENKTSLLEVPSTVHQNDSDQITEKAAINKISLTSGLNDDIKNSINEEVPINEISSPSGQNDKHEISENKELSSIKISSTSEQNEKVQGPETEEILTIKMSSTSGSNGKIQMPESDEVLTITKTSPEVASKDPINEKSEEVRDVERVHEIDTIATCSPRRSRYLTKHLTVMTYQWFIASMTQSVVLGVSTEASHNRHVNFAIGSVFEVIVYVLTYFILTRYGRRLPMSLCQLFSGGVCITVGILAVSQSSDVLWIGPTRTIFLLIGRATVVGTLATAYLFTVEIFPTVIRGACLGLCVVFGTIGSLSAPYILSLKNHTTIAAPLTVVGVLSLISGLICLVLPETVNERLPDTAQQMGRKSTRNKIGVVNGDYERAETDDKQSDREILREKLFSEDWVDAGNGIIVNFSENKN